MQLDDLVHDVSRLRRSAIEQVLRPTCITYAQWQVLEVLSLHGGQSMMQRELGTWTSTGKVVLGLLLGQLETRRLIARRPQAADRRVKRVVLTDGGRRFLAAIQAATVSVDSRIPDGISRDDMACAEAVLDRLCKQLREMGAAPIACGGRAQTARRRAQAGPVSAVDRNASVP